MGPDTADYVLVGVYLAACFVIVGVVSFRQHQAKKQHTQREDDANNFFLAEHCASWWAVAASFFSSNIGSDAILGLSSAGATYGISAGFFDFTSALAFIALAYGFLPVYRKCGVFTLPEFIEKRYSQALKIYLAGLAVVLYVVGKVAVSLYCGSIMIEAILDVNPTVAIAVLLGVTCVFTASGGLKAVIYVEVFNTVLLIVGGLVAAGYCLHAVGGWQGMQDHLVSIKQPQLGHLYQTSGQYSIFGLLLGGPWMILFFHCCDQEMVQRGLAARNGQEGKLGCILAGFMKLTVPWAWCIPGIVARILYPRDLQCPLGGGTCEDANNAYPSIVLNLLPNGLKGIMLAASIAGVLSVLASTFNSAATLVAMDLFRTARPRTSSTALTWIGRLAIVIITGLSIVWLPLLNKLSPSLYSTMQSLNAYTAPPVLTVFLGAMFWPRATSTGALLTLGVGHTIGFGRLILTLALGVKSEYNNHFLNVYLASDFLLFALSLGVISVVTLVVGSYASKAHDIATIRPFLSPLIAKLYEENQPFEAETTPAVDVGTPIPLVTGPLPFPPVTGPPAVVVHPKDEVLVATETISDSPMFHNGTRARSSTTESLLPGIKLSRPIVCCGRVSEITLSHATLSLVVGLVAATAGMLAFVW